MPTLLIMPSKQVRGLTEKGTAETRRRESKNGNGNLIRNMSQDGKLKVATGKMWKNTFSKQLLQDCPTSKDKIKLHKMTRQGQLL
jgi:hypothetical protein